MTAKDFLKTAESIEDEIIENRRWLHAHAETEFDLKETTAFVKEKLQEIGLEYTDCGKCGISAIIGKNEGKTFLLRADMDALPINEESGLDFSCGNGVKLCMVSQHGCG